jgi:hypothetical protein
MSARRLLRQFHRWLGAGLSLLVLIWFASGMVMTFAGFPSVSEHERLTHAGPLLAATLRVEPPRVLAASGRQVDSVSVEAWGGRALYRVRANGKATAIYADSGEQASFLDERALRTEANAWFTASVVRSDRIEEVDQWTPQADRDGELPFLRLRADDSDGSELYISLVDGKIVQATTRRARLFAWFGAIPHWVYPIQLRRHTGTWRVTVIVLASLAASMCVAGLIHGLITARFARRRRLTLSPFRDSGLAWHHVLGLGFGVVSFTWLASGVLSFDPLGNWASSEPSEADIAAFRGGGLAPESFSRPLAEALEECRSSLKTDVKRIELARAGGAPFYVCKSDSGATRVVSAAAPQPPTASPSLAQVGGFARKLGRGARVTSEAWLTSGDAYYYPTHFAPDLPFPVLRTRFESGLVTYVNPTDLTVVRCYSPGAAVYRWLYHGLHSWDLPYLYRRRWLWHPVIVIALLSGAALAGSGVWLSLRWLWLGSRARATPAARAARSPRPRFESGRGSAADSPRASS